MTRTAIELAAASTRLGNPDDGLRAVAELRRRLDELEAWHVENAIRAGRSWAHVADCLGVSKQAAHKKHARAVRAGGRTAFAEAARERGVVVTAEARRVVQHAAREARSLGHARIGTGHVLLGLLHEPHVASAALERLGITRDALSRVIRPATAPVTGDVEMPMRISVQARRALEQSLREAVARGDGHLGVEHLLLALLRDERSDAARTLESFRAAAQDVEAALAERERRGRNVRPHA